jgi:rfaE bifunctional protein kinase chain/domain
MSDFDKLFERFSGMKACVIGDVMLDTYWWGHVERISPEAPVPVVSLDKREYRIGGAGNVALNLASLGANVAVFSVIGDDENGVILKDLLDKHRIITRHLVKSKHRITTNKARIISRNQQMMRLDSETTQDLAKEDEDLLLEQIKTHITRDKPQVMVFEDYNKGVLTGRVIHDVIGLCRDSGILTAVDPKRKNFFAYHDVDIFKPNLKEVREALNIHPDQISPEALEQIHKQLSGKLNNRISLITLSERGVFYQTGSHFKTIPSHLRNIADVSGAGDTVIAVASLVYAATGNADLMAEVANVAGGLVCEEVGTVAIDKERLKEECSLLVKPLQGA